MGKITKGSPRVSGPFTPLRDRSFAGASAPAAPGWRVLAVLSLLMGFASISTDLYLPAMPEMSRSLHANEGLVELTISGYLLLSLFCCGDGNLRSGREINQ